MGRNNEDFLATMGISRQEQEQMTRNALIGHHEDNAANPETTEPCINCGTSVPSEIHQEEGGYCVDCQHKLFNDYPVEGSSHTENDGCHECAVCGKHSESDEEADNHRCFE
jgi:DNA-directed RNA polymerase subunit RPC12/RpoP